MLNCLPLLVCLDRQKSLIRYFTFNSNPRIVSKTDHTALRSSSGIPGIISGIPGIGATIWHVSESIVQCLNSGTLTGPAVRVIVPLLCLTSRCHLSYDPTVAKKTNIRSELQQKPILAVRRLTQYGHCALLCPYF